MDLFEILPPSRVGVVIVRGPGVVGVPSADSAYKQEEGSEIGVSLVETFDILLGEGRTVEEGEEIV